MRHRQANPRRRRPSGPRGTRRAFRRRGASPSGPRRPLSAALALAGYSSLLAACGVFWSALFAAATLGAPIGMLGFALSVCLMAAGLFALGEA